MASREIAARWRHSMKCRSELYRVICPAVSPWRLDETSVDEIHPLIRPTCSRSMGGHPPEQHIFPPMIPRISALFGCQNRDSMNTEMSHTNGPHHLMLPSWHRRSLEMTVNAFRALRRGVGFIPVRTLRLYKSSQVTPF
jgi:hypothetical protein